MIRPKRLSRGGALLGLLLTSCASTAPIESGPPLFFPLPPAEPRIQFLTFANGSGEVVRKRSGLELFALGEDSSPSWNITKPYGIAARDGVVYVCDTKRPSIARLDFKDQTYGVFGERGGGALRKPINIVVDSLGYKFVTDTVREQIIVFGPSDEFVKAFDLPSSCHPVDLAIRGNEIYLLDNDETPRILVLDRITGEVQRSFGSQGQEPGQFNRPSSLCLDSEGNVYVSDTLNNRIQKLSPHGESVWERGNPGYYLGQFGRPRGIRVAPDGVVYIVEGAMQLVQMFDDNGDVLMRFGGPGNIPGAMLLPAAIAIDDSSIPYFAEYVHPDFEVDYLLFVTNQYGPRLVNVYAFGGFPEGYRLGEGEIGTLEPIEDPEGGIGAVDPAAEIPVQPGEHPQVPAEPEGGEEDPEEPGPSEESPHQDPEDGPVSHSGSARFMRTEGEGPFYRRERFTCGAVRSRSC